MLTRKTVVLAKIEAAYGTDPTPTPTANAILVSDLDIKPAGEVAERSYMKSSLSQPPFLRGPRSVDLTFRTELKGTGTRGQLPAWGWEGVLLRACGMAETVTANTSIAYAPVSANFESCALYVYRDQVFHKVLGCRGSFRILAEVGKHIAIEWKFRGLYTSPADASPGAQTFSSVIPPLVLSAGLTIGGYSAVAERLEIDMNVDIGPRRSMNAATGIAGMQIGGRSPRGSFVPEAVTEATAPFWNNWETAAAVALALGPVGSASGTIVAIGAPKLQYREMGYGDRSGTLVYQVPFSLAMNTGDDELTITIT
jgi:hypothetical protein